MKKVVVVAAIIIHDDKILCVQRAKNKYLYISEKFEFPGGKIEPGETEIQALKREIEEELSLDIDVHDKFLTVYYEYPDFELELHTYLCSCTIIDFILHEHIDYRWVARAELSKLDWPAANAAIIEKLMEGS